jgi:hypothetical protein
MAKKDLQNIAVRTVSNGYILTVGTIDYMAFSIEQLVNCFFAHVAVGKKAYLDSETAEALVEAAATWKDQGEAYEAVAKWMSLARKAEKREQAAARGQANANARADELEDKCIELKKEAADLRAQLAKHKQFGTMLVGCKVVDDPGDKFDYKLRKSDVVPPKKKKGKSRYARRND